MASACAFGIVIAALITLAIQLTHKAKLLETDRERAINKLREQMEESRRAESEIRRFKEALENTVEGIARLNNEGKYISVNKAYASIAGYMPDEMEGMNWEETVHPGDRNMIAECFQRMLEHGKVEAEARGLRRDGTVFYKHVVLVTAYDENRKISGHHCFMKDITDKKIAEDLANQKVKNIIRQQIALLELAKLDTLKFDDTLKRVAEIDAVTLGADRVSIWFVGENNKTIQCRLLFTEDRKLSGKLSYVDIEKYPDFFKTLTESRVVTNNELRSDPLTFQLCSDYHSTQEYGSRLYAPVRLHGKVVGVVCHEYIGNIREFSFEEKEFASSVANSVSLALASEERRRSEKILEKQANELARSNTDLEQFAYVASHDLQEPLRMVASYTQLLARRYKGKLDKDADEFIGYAVDGVTRMQHLINDLLAYSRLQIKEKALQEIDCSHVLSKSLTNLQTTLQDSGASVTCENLVQLFQNLIGNGIKFRGDQKPQIHISAERTNGKWTFAVKDNGIGIDQKYTDRIFAIFQRLHGKQEYPGTGIGLAICKRIVERHGGRIWVESEPQKGSTFYFTIPVRRPQRIED
jgi:PAS domain S-box-containing protein